MSEARSASASDRRTPSASEGRTPSAAEDLVLYFDLASPYAYLAVMRAHSVLRREPLLQPVLAGAIFADRGWGSWAHTPTRQQNMAEIERRAAAYGLPIAWPEGWPPNALVAQRAAIHAQRRRLIRPFAEAVYLATYGGGRRLDGGTILDAGESAGIDRGELSAAVADPEVKLALRAATDEAISRGVIGVPTLRVGGELHFGDDRLEDAAATLL